MAEEIHVGDIGTRFLCTFKDEDAAGAEVIVDIGPATLLAFHFQAPSGSWRTVTPSLLTDGSDGKAFYDIAYASELDEAATNSGPKPLWRLQGEVSIGTGNWRSSVPDFEVHPNIGPPRALTLKPSPSICSTAGAATVVS